MGFLDDYEEDERPRRRRKRGSEDDDRVGFGWQDMVAGLDPDAEPEEEEEPLEEEDEMQELEVDDHGRIRNQSSLDSSFWDEESEE